MINGFGLCQMFTVVMHVKSWFISSDPLSPQQGTRGGEPQGGSMTVMYGADDDSIHYSPRAILNQSSPFSSLIVHYQISVNQREPDSQPDAYSPQSSASLNDEATVRTHNQRCSRRRDSHTGEHNSKSGARCNCLHAFVP